MTARILAPNQIENQHRHVHSVVAQHTQTCLCALANGVFVTCIRMVHSLVQKDVEQLCLVENVPAPRSPERKQNGRVRRDRSDKPLLTQDSSAKGLGAAKVEPRQKLLRDERQYAKHILAVEVVGPLALLLHRTKRSRKKREKRATPT